MHLETIIQNTALLRIVGNTQIEIKHLFLDSRQKSEEGLFFAIKGSLSDGHQYIHKAIENGAIAIVCQNLPEHLEEGITYVKVENSAVACGVMSHNFYGKPSLHLQLIGVTGTNGKTTTTSLLYDLYQKLGYQCALISTIENKIGDTIIPSTHTTPDAISLNSLLAEAVDAQCEYAFMEVSSHSIHQHRVAGLHFAVAAFTNITHDHLDYHNTFQEYLYAKKAFFDQVEEDTIALINWDDRNGEIMVQNSKAEVKTYGLKTLSDYKGKVKESQIDGMLLEFNGKEFWFPLAGEFNAYNALLVFAVASELGEDETEVLQTLSNIAKVKGRFEVLVTESPIYVVVDYAHTPDALENILKNLSKIKRPDQQLITVFGCGGNRDKEKRPLMGKIAAQYSDQVIITSDNPRDENPQTIIEEIETGLTSEDFQKTISNVDRKQAIKQALQMAKTNDIVCIAGKGHEDYQIIKGEKTHFSDIETANELAKQLKK